MPSVSALFRQILLATHNDSFIPYLFSINGICQRIVKEDPLPCLQQWLLSLIRAEMEDTVCLSLPVSCTKAPLGRCARFLELACSDSRGSHLKPVFYENKL